MHVCACLYIGVSMYVCVFTACMCMYVSVWMKILCKCMQRPEQYSRCHPLEQLSALLSVVGGCLFVSWPISSSDMK